MRAREVKDGLTVNVIAGTHVVFFGMDLAPKRRKGFRGFAFKRLDHTVEDTIWLTGLKSFEATEPHPAVGEKFSTRNHPIQSFQWADYSAKPGRRYTYTVLALYGKPDKLDPKVEVDLTISTEKEWGPRHSVFFNRGSAATQEYARRFQNRKPEDAGDGAYDWLSRGLLEALVGFLGRARKGWEIHGAVYEFQWPAALAALKEAAERGAKVRILFDDIVAWGKKRNGTRTPKGPWQANRNAIRASGLPKGTCQGLRHGKLMHNKFFVLSKGGEPASVWTGSTNLTLNGIFGHSNLGHAVTDAAVAREFRAYWDRLQADPPVNAATRAANEAASPAPPAPWNRSTTSVFSPRGTQLGSLRWYADLAGKAEGALFMTFAFGMHDFFKAVYQQDDEVLRMALMEKEGNASSREAAERNHREIAAIRGRANVVVAIGNRIPTNAFDRWLAEMSRVTDSAHVYWIHTKYLLADPLAKAPLVVTGSANFSKASTDTNSENMLVIRGDRRVADIYFGEFQRLYTHYAFREAVKRALDNKKVETAEKWKPQYLIANDSWMKDYFNTKDRTGRNLRRRYFGGPMAV